MSTSAVGSASNYNYSYMTVHLGTNLQNSTAKAFLAVTAATSGNVQTDCNTSFVQSSDLLMAALNSTASIAASGSTSLL